MTLDIQTLRHAHEGQPVYIIGKGPSLAALKKEDIGDGIVITLNQAIIKVEMLGIDNQIYSMQKDGCGDREPHDVCLNEMVRPQKAALIVHEHESKHCLEDYEPRYIFSNENDFGIPWYAFSALSAMKIADLMGCKKTYFVSFDSAVNGDYRAYAPDSNGGGKIIPANIAYDIQSRIMTEYLNTHRKDYTWIMPSEY